MNERTEATKSPAGGVGRAAIGPEEFALASTLVAGRPAEERRGRHRARIDCILYVSLRSGNGGIVLDISETGMALYAAGPLEINESIYFRFLVPSIGRLEIRGELIWVDETRKRCGVRFVDLQEEALAEIRKWVAPGETNALRTLVGEPAGRFAAAQALAAQAVSSASRTSGDRQESNRESAREEPATELVGTETTMVRTASAYEDSPSDDAPGGTALDVADAPDGEAPDVLSQMDAGARLSAENAEGEPKKLDFYLSMVDSQPGAAGSSTEGGAQTPERTREPETEGLAASAEAASATGSGAMGDEARATDEAIASATKETEPSESPSVAELKASAETQSNFSVRADTARSIHTNEKGTVSPVGQGGTAQVHDKLPVKERGPVEWTATRARALPDEAWREYANELRRDATKKLVAIGAVIFGSAILLLSFTHRVALGHAMIEVGARISGVTVTISKDAGAESSDATASSSERRTVAYQTGEQRALRAVEISTEAGSSGSGLEDDLGPSATDAGTHDAKYTGGVDLSETDQQPIELSALETAALKAGAAQGKIPGASGVDDKGQAELKLARQYLSESEVGATKSPAAELLWLAVEKGNTDAEIDLADLYGRGEGVQKNCQQARTLLAAVSDSNDPYLRGKAAAELNILGCK